MVDSREQAPLKFKVKGNVSRVETIGLLFGDYQAMLENGTVIPITFERKSMPDLYATLSNEDGIRRHKAKIERANEHGHQLYLIIDGSLSDAYKGVGHSKVEAEPLVKRIFTFKVKYGLHPIFCNDTDEMMDYMIETWEAFGRNYSKV